MVFPRKIEDLLRLRATQYPTVCLTGPRQSGKSTIVVKTFPDKSLVSLEPTDTRAFAQNDPRAFLERYRDGAIFDEVQRAPDLFSYLQEEVDRDPTPGRFILTGSENLSLTNAVSQSLAGRAAMLNLLPLTYDESSAFPLQPKKLYEVIITGGYPRIHNTEVSNIPARVWLADYITNYVERDVRLVLNVSDLQSFSQFLKICAANSGRVLNLSRMGRDVGVTHNTCKRWLSILEASFVCFRIPAWTPNIRAQITKSPKLHFFDTGVLCHLLGMRSASDLEHHPLRGEIFENWVAAEIHKTLLHSGKKPALYHFRKNRGAEIDLLSMEENQNLLIEMKSSMTVQDSVLTRFAEEAMELSKTLPKKTNRAILVQASEARHTQSGIEVTPWNQLNMLASTA